MLKLNPTPVHALDPLPWSNNYRIALELACLMHREERPVLVTPMMPLPRERMVCSPRRTMTVTSLMSRCGSEVT